MTMTESLVFILSLALVLTAYGAWRDKIDTIHELCGKFVLAYVGVSLGHIIYNAFIHPLL